MNTADLSTIDWSRAQFALTAMYHWLFVPLTLGLGLLMSIYETYYYKTGDPNWKKIAKFWQKLFGINFAIGVATGIILEFQFGTNWSNYSWIVGDIFGAPLAIEGILAFFMESTFIAVMFFGWNKVSRGFHLSATWLTWIGASISAFWILVANAWMQFPVGMEFNVDTMRHELTSFLDVISPMAINKFYHTITSGWIVGSAFVIGVCAWFMLKGKESDLVRKSIPAAAIFGLIGTLLSTYTGDKSAQDIAQYQPMKLAAMEGLYEGGVNQPLVVFGILNPKKTTVEDNINPFLFKLEIPHALSFLTFGNSNAYVPGIKNLIDGYHTIPLGENNPFSPHSITERIESGKVAIQALSDIRLAKKNNDPIVLADASYVFDKNRANFGYGYLPSPEKAIPPVALTFYSFHLMVLFGIFFLLFFPLVWWLHRKEMFKKRWILWICILSVPLAYITSQLGWVVAEVGRQPWLIQDFLPTYAAISNIGSSSVQTTFFLFLVLFTILLVAELKIMFTQINKGS